MPDYHLLSTTNAERPCGACSDRQATAYVHGTGYRCGECADVPDELREHDTEGPSRAHRTDAGPADVEEGVDPRENGNGNGAS